MINFCSSFCDWCGSAIEYCLDADRDIQRGTESPPEPEPPPTTQWVTYTYETNTEQTSEPPEPPKGKEND